ncbi:glycine cleavage T C-terminal barrel domain-containing protein [Streptomyces sp. NPDC057474]|uniref:glycine cleavage T C-terminal barrel domain-containing protein n=1 Tax=Streptomyces sp. NPDC057474 TaxID=3346144 RepID=UPI0036764E6C
MSSSSESLVSQLRRPLKYHAGDIWGPPQFTNWVDEERSWKENCYIGDWSFLPSLRYTGPDALRLFADCSVNTMGNFRIGQSKHIIHCNHDGKVIEEGILTRTGEQELIAYSTYWADYIRRTGDYDVEMEPIEEVKYHLQGPNALYVLESLLGREFRDIKFMRNETVTIAGVQTRVLRQGMSGEIGFELQAPLADGRKLWEAVVDAGQEYDIHELGGRVAMLNHLQAAYPTVTIDYLPALFDEVGIGYREEIQAAEGGYFEKYYWAVAGSFESDDVRDWYRSPVELGWGNRINFDHRFPGDEALRRELEAPKRTLCTLRWNADDVIDIFASFFRQGELPDFMEMPQDPRAFMYFDKVLKDGAVVGATSSRGYSAHFREMISLAVVDVEVARPGTEVTVIWGNPGTPQREIRAVTAPAPYKEVRSRVDLKSLPKHLVR